MPSQEGRHPRTNQRRMKMKTLHSIGAAIVMSALVAGAATAAQMKAAGPQPGDCKRAYEAINRPVGSRRPGACGSSWSRRSTATSGPTGSAPRTSRSRRSAAISSRRAASPASTSRFPDPERMIGMARRKPRHLFEVTAPEKPLQASRCARRGTITAAPPLRVTINAERDHGRER